MKLSFRSLLLTLNIPVLSLAQTAEIPFSAKIYSNSGYLAYGVYESYLFIENDSRQTYFLCSFLDANPTIAITGLWEQADSSLVLRPKGYILRDPWGDHTVAKTVEEKADGFDEIACKYQETFAILKDGSIQTLPYNPRHIVGYDDLDEEDKRWLDYWTGIEGGAQPYSRTFYPLTHYSQPSYYIDSGQMYDVYRALSSIKEYCCPSTYYTLETLVDRCYKWFLPPYYFSFKREFFPDHDSLLRLSSANTSRLYYTKSSKGMKTTSSFLLLLRDKINTYYFFSNTSGSRIVSVAGSWAEEDSLITLTPFGGIVGSLDKTAEMTVLNQTEAICKQRLFNILKNGSLKEVIEDSAPIGNYLLFLPFDFYIEPFYFANLEDKEELYRVLERAKPVINATVYQTLRTMIDRNYNCTSIE